MYGRELRKRHAHTQKREVMRRDETRQASRKKGARHAASGGEGDEGTVEGEAGFGEGEGLLAAQSLEHNGAASVASPYTNVALKGERERERGAKTRKKWKNSQ